MKKPIKSFLSVILVLTMLLISFSMITSADNAQTTEDIVLDEILNIENTEKTEARNLILGSFTEFQNSKNI